MPVWTRTPNGRYVAEPLANAWLDIAMSLSQPSVRTVATVRGQQEQVDKAWDALRQACLAMDLNPLADPLGYVAEFDAAYGGQAYMSTTGAVPIQGRIGLLCKSIVAAAGGPVDRTNAGDATMFVRRALDRAARVHGRCFAWNDPACPFAGLFVGRAAPRDARCSQDGDWNCLYWNDAPAQAVRVLPPLVQSLDLAYRIASSWRRSGVLAVAERTPNGSLRGTADASAYGPPGNNGVREDIPVNRPPTTPPTTDPACASPPVNPTRAAATAWNAAHPSCRIQVPVEDPPPDPACAGAPARPTQAEADAWNAAHPTCPVLVFVGGSTPDPACAAPPANPTRADALGWNAYHPSCPVQVPPETGGGGDGPGGGGGSNADPACASPPLNPSRDDALGWNAYHPSCPVRVPGGPNPAPVSAAAPSAWKRWGVPALACSLGIGAGYVGYLYVNRGA